MCRRDATRRHRYSVPIGNSVPWHRHAKTPWTTQPLWRRCINFFTAHRKIPASPRRTVGLSVSHDSASEQLLLCAALARAPRHRVSGDSPVVYMYHRTNKRTKQRSLMYGVRGNRQRHAWRGESGLERETVQPQRDRACNPPRRVACTITVPDSGFAQLYPPGMTGFLQFAGRDHASPSDRQRDAPSHRG